MLLGSSSAYSGAQDVQESVAGMWLDVGVKTNILSLDPATSRAKSRALEFDNHIGVSTSSSNQFIGSGFTTAHYRRGLVWKNLSWTGFSARSCLR